MESKKKIASIRVGRSYIRTSRRKIVISYREGRAYVHVYDVGPPPPHYIYTSLQNTRAWVAEKKSTIYIYIYIYKPLCRRRRRPMKDFEILLVAHSLATKRKRERHRRKQKMFYEASENWEKVRRRRCSHSNTHKRSL